MKFVWRFPTLCLQLSLTNVCTTKQTMGFSHSSLNLVLELFVSCFAQEKAELIQLADVMLAARREAQDTAQFFGATVHFLGKPKKVQDAWEQPQVQRSNMFGEMTCPRWTMIFLYPLSRFLCLFESIHLRQDDEDGGVDAFPSPWVEGGMFLLPDGSHCQLCTRIMWFDDAGHLIRVIVNQVRTQTPPTVNVDIRLWSAQPDICQMAGLGIHQACTVRDTWLEHESYESRT